MLIYMMIRPSVSSLHIHTHPSLSLHCLGRKVEAVDWFDGRVGLRNSVRAFGSCPHSPTLPHPTRAKIIGLYEPQSLICLFIHSLTHPLTQSYSWSLAHSTTSLSHSQGTPSNLSYSLSVSKLIQPRRCVSIVEIYKYIYTSFPAVLFFSPSTIKYMHIHLCECREWSDVRIRIFSLTGHMSAHSDVPLTVRVSGNRFRDTEPRFSRSHLCLVYMKK